MTRIIAIAKIIFVLAFATLCAYFLVNRLFVSLTIFFVFFLVGFFIRHREVFWKISLVFYGLLSTMFSFRIFGGLEPNTPGVISSGDWLNLDSLLYFMMVVSTVMAFVAGLADLRLRKSGPHKTG